VTVEDNDIFRGYGVEVQLYSSEDFLKVAETLTRIGVSARNENRLYQTCHILHKRGRYAIVHFKEMLALDGNDTNYNEDDEGRRNKIVQLLEQWKLVKVLNPTQVEQPLADISKIKVIPHREKQKWQLIAKYSIGKRK
jgi:hypothetical protein